MKYLVVGIVAFIYIFTVFTIIQVNNMVAKAPTVIELGETYVNKTE